MPQVTSADVRKAMNQRDYLMRRPSSFDNPTQAQLVANAINARVAAYLQPKEFLRRGLYPMFEPGGAEQHIDLATIPTLGKFFRINIHPRSAAGGKLVDIIKNPDMDDLRYLAKQFRKKYPRSGKQPYSRSTYDAAGNEYIWRSDKATHGDVERILKSRFGVKVSQHPTGPFRIK